MLYRLDVTMATSLSGHLYTANRPKKIIKQKMKIEKLKNSAPLQKAHPEICAPSSKNGICERLPLLQSIVMELIRLGLLIHSIAMFFSFCFLSLGNNSNEKVLLERQMDELQLRDWWQKPITSSNVFHQNLIPHISVGNVISGPRGPRSKVNCVSLPVELDNIRSPRIVMKSMDYLGY